MKPFFVRFRDGHREIEWLKLLAGSALVVVLTAALFEGVWYLIAGRAGLGVLIASLVPSTLVVARMVAGTFAVQDQECEEEVTVGPA